MPPTSKEVSRIYLAGRQCRGNLVAITDAVMN